MQQTLEFGKSIYFMVASNPGPGLGLLLAYSFYGKKVAKRTAPGAIIIHFFGGIHELYFPYVLMKPITILSMILGGASGIMTFQLFGVGLVAGPSPGSIFAYLALTPRGNFIGVIAGVLVATAVSFFVTSLILKADKTEDEDDDESLTDSIKKSKMMKEEGKKIGASYSGKAISSKYKKISFACDAGMGSSALGASAFKKQLKNMGIDDIEVKHYRIEDVPKDSDVVVVHKDLAERFKLMNDTSRIVPIESYLKDIELESLIDEIKDSL
jgi:PTS system mannitol-specific IIC component